MEKQVSAFRLALGCLLLGWSIQGFAATNPSLSISATTIAGTCADSVFTITSEWDAVDSDGINCDVVGVIAYDALGVPVASDWDCTTPPETGYIRPSPFGPHGGFGESIINNMTARPLTVEMYDLDFEPEGGRNFQAQYDEIANSGAPELLSLTYDPASEVPACASLPGTAAPAQSVPVPALSAWALLLLGLTVAMVAAGRLGARRR